jgi:ribose transport system permease protein
MTVANAPQRNALPENPAMSDEEASRAHGVVARLRETTAFWMFLVLLGLVGLFSIISPNHVFFSLSNLFSIALNASQLVLLAAGMTFLLGARQIDLSVGANVVLSSILAAKTITALAGTPDQVSMGEYPNLAVALVAGTMVAMASGMAYGLINGLMVTRLRLSSFLVTLATTAIGLGTALVITHGANVPDIPRVLQVSFATYRVGGVIPIPVLISLAVAAILWFVLAKTKFGVHTLALGSSPEAARRAGINAEAHLLILFCLMGLLVGCAAMLDISRFVLGGDDGGTCHGHLRVLEWPDGCRLAA